MSVVEVVGEGRLFVFVHQIWVGAVCSDGHCQEAVYDYICVPVGDNVNMELIEL